MCVTRRDRKTDKSLGSKTSSPWLLLVLDGPKPTAKPRLHLYYMPGYVLTTADACLRPFGAAPDHALLRTEVVKSLSHRCVLIQESTSKAGFSCRLEKIPNRSPNFKPKFYNSLLRLHVSNFRESFHERRLPRKLPWNQL